jgi:Neuraminidase-like domain/Salmonella virulence plasmid 28.1kDa A protein
VQIHNATLNIALAYMTARNGIGLGVPGQLTESAIGTPGGIYIRPAPTGTAAANASDIAAYATLEQLFNNLDFCECEQCGSIFSPAAYLVDLLEFANVTEASRLGGKSNPQQVLFGRRPDIQYLPLTCENTNTALPYIDIVNETLEYFVANGAPNALSLVGYQGHDTGGADSPDLLASPQYVNAAAYAALQTASFPPPLPFDQPLESLRRYFQKFGVPLGQAMERLITVTTLARGSAIYGWDDVWMETIGVSREERRILCGDPTDLSLTDVYGLPPGTSDADAVAALANAKQFSRRLNISYDDLIAVLKTWFVNPNSPLIAKVERLTVPFAALKVLHDSPLGGPFDTQFDVMLPAGAAAPDPAEFGGDIKRWVRDDANYNRIMALITLADITASADPASYVDTCDFDNFELRHAMPMANPTDTSTRLAPVEYIRIARFVRFWRKLGWTIEQTDAAICALFGPSAAAPAEGIAAIGAADVDTVAKLDAGCARVLRRLGLVARLIGDLGLRPDRDLPLLLTCWADIRTSGQDPLYRRLFLSPAILAQDAIFNDNGFGAYLTTTATLADHAPAVRAALNLSGDEYDSIIASLPATATGLTIANLSSILRRAWLARALKISVRELLMLVGLTGLNPFADPDLTNAAVLRLAEVILALKQRSIKTTAALYLVWNQDLSGQASPSADAVTQFARTLRGDFASINDDFSATDDPAGDVARARVTQVYGQDASDTFFGLLDETIRLQTAYTQTDNTLSAAIAAADPALSYDPFAHTLTHVGRMTVALAGMLNGIPSASPAFQAAVNDLRACSDAAEGAFFALYSDLQAAYLAYHSSADPVPVRRAALLAAIDPDLGRIRKRQQAIQRLSASAGASLDFTGTLVDGLVAPFAIHAAGNAARPVMDDILAIETPGLRAEFYDSATAVGAIALTLPHEAILEYAPLVDGLGNALPANGAAPGAPISVIFSGQLEIPETAPYNLLVEAEIATVVTITLSGALVPLTQNGTVWRNTAPLPLTGGSFCALAIRVDRVTGRLRVQWESYKRARETIPGRYLYAPAQLDPFSEGYLRFLKAAALASALGLTAKEVARPRVAAQCWLNPLPVVGSAAAPATLLPPFRALLDYAGIKADLRSSLTGADDELLFDALAAPTAVATDALISLTQWDPGSLIAMAGHFGATVAQLTDLPTFHRVYDAMSLAGTMGINAAALIAAATDAPVVTSAVNTLRDLQAALRARYAADDWRSVVQPINDAMRDLRRDALVAHILQQFRVSADAATRAVDTPDRLFEYFLMDVQMEPCVQTSRMRHALSSVQLFIDRCLMNLETRVAAKAINAARWEWMKRYRVWEANRRVFVYPENWLDPELRDDKSPFFKEIESELLQGDITDDSAAAAMLKYLSRLEEVAKLEPVGFCHIPADAGSLTAEIDHVIARTAGSRRTYYYRRQESGYWTAWEPVKLDIEDNPVVPYVWNDRLMLFWLKVLKHGPATAATPAKTGKLTDLTTGDLPGNPVVQVHAALCWSEYYNGKWQPAKTSDIDYPGTIGTAWNATGDLPRSLFRLWVSPAQDGTLWVHAYAGQAAHFHFYNTHSLPALGGVDEADYVYPSMLGRFFRYLDWTDASDDGGPFSIEYTFPGGGGVAPISFERTPLNQTNRFQLTEPGNLVPDPLVAPFFFADRRHVFWVTSTSQPVTIWEFNGVSIANTPGKAVNYKIPGIVQQTVPDFPSWWWGDGGPVDPSNPVLNPGIVSANPTERFVNSDARVGRGLATVATVEYDGSQLGPGAAIKSATE